MLLDEATLVPESFFEMAISRLTFPSSKAFMSCNCDGPNHFLKKKYIDQNKLDEVVNFSLNDESHALDKKTRTRLEGMFSGVFKKRKIDNEWAECARA